MNLPTWCWEESWAAEIRASGPLPCVEGLLQSELFPAPWRETELLEETKAGGGEGLTFVLWRTWGLKQFPLPTPTGPKNPGGVSPICPRYPAYQLSYREKIKLSRFGFRA